MKYKLGIDIGTNAIGWAVLDDNNDLVRKLGHSMRGVRMFDGSNDASDRRSHRSTRRMIRRRKERINLLRDIFKDEINQIDSTFFKRLDESFFDLEDRTLKDNQLFKDLMSDSNYYKKYPTISHLKSALIHEDNVKFDLRLVYLSLHNIIKYRGNFLYEGDKFEKGNLSKVKEYLSDFNDVVKIYYDRLIQDEENDISLPEYFKSIDLIDDTLIEDIKEIYFSNENKKIKKKLLIEKLNVSNNGVFADFFVTPLVFGKINLKKTIPLKDIFESNSIIDFDLENYNEELINAANAANSFGLLVTSLNKIKSIRDFFFIMRLLGQNDSINEAYLSDSYVRLYEEHSKDLRRLKKLFKNYLPSKYNEFFRTYRNGAKTYSNYVGFTIYKKRQNFKHCSREEFYNELASLLSLINNPNAEDEKNYFLHKIENKSLLLRQNSSSNAAIPMQLNLEELIKIIDNQSKFYPFLNEEHNGVKNKDKILAIFKFKRPYNIGTLKGGKEKDNNYSWAVLKNEGYAYPWNFNEIVDLDKTEINFIENMQKKCTYLKGNEDFALPKDSILLNEYNVLSYINKLKIDGNYVDRDVKDGLYNDVFLTNYNPTKKDIASYLNSRYGDIVNPSDIPDCNVSMKSFLDFKGVFDNVDEKIYLAELIIKDIVIFNNDKEVLAKRLKNVYHLNDDQVKKIKNFNYKGFGKHCLKLLTGLNIRNKESGEIYTGILPIMRETNLNLQEILYSNNFNLKQVIDEYNKKFIDIKKDDEEAFINFIEENLSLSPIYYRAFIQSYKLIDEIEDILGEKIDTYVLEVTRSKGEKGKKSKSRYERIKDLYKECRNITKELNLSKLNEELDSKAKLVNKSDKYYLYFTQFGRDIYTYDPINIEHLNLYDIDHIYPQSIIKDDSLTNRVLTLHNKNKEKGDNFLPDLRRKGFFFENADVFYKFLYEKGFISKGKYQRLTEKEINPDMFTSFINRQKVATDQANMALIATLKYFKGIDEEKIIYSKATIISDFRNHFEYFDHFETNENGEKKPIYKELYLPKSRLANNYHHAHDAYLNAYVGSTLSNYYKSIYLKNDRKYSINPNQILKKDQILNNKLLWVTSSLQNRKSDIDRIYETISNNYDIQETFWTYNRNLMFKQVLIKPKGEGIMSAKRVTPNGNIYKISKYGGIMAKSYSKYVIAEGIDKKGKTISLLIGIPKIYSDNFEDYIKKNYCEYKNIHIVVENVKINDLFNLDKKFFVLRGVSTEHQDFYIRNAKDRNFKQDFISSIKKIEKYLKQLNANENIKIDEFSIKLIEKNQKDDLFREIVLTREELENLYCEIVNYFGKEIYSFDIITSIREKCLNFDYKNVDIEKFTILIYELLNLLKTNEMKPVDLRQIDMSPTSGKMRIGKVLKKGLKLIRTSITGLKSKVIYEVK